MPTMKARLTHEYLCVDDGEGLFRGTNLHQVHMGSAHRTLIQKCVPFHSKHRESENDDDGGKTTRESIIRRVGVCTFLIWRWSSITKNSKDFGCYECTIKAVLAEVEREWLCSPSYVTMSIDGSSSDRSTCFRAGQPRMLLHLQYPLKIKNSKQSSEQQFRRFSIIPHFNESLTN